MEPSPALEPTVASGLRRRAASSSLRFPAEANRNSPRGRAIATLISLLNLGCASPVEVPAVSTQPADLPAGYGEVVGTILLSTPAGASSADDQQIIGALRAKRYEAVIGRFVIHDYGIARRVEHPGDRYRVSFSMGVEQPFVIRAPAGSYSIQKISSTVSTVIGPQPGGCRIEGLANLNIREGETIYVGRLSMVASFKPDRGRRMVQTLRNLGRISLEHPEATLDMKVSAVDLKDDGLQKLGIGESERRARIGTELMFVDQRKSWDCISEPPPAPPALPQKR